MDYIYVLFHFIMHMDEYLNEIIKNYGIYTYIIIFIVIFAETGFVVTPFLPGDSLLFVIGAFAAKGSFSLPLALIILTLAAVLGDTLNYHIGKFFGPKIFRQEHIKFLKKEYLIRTQDFYKKHGGKTIIIARFVPIIRTFAPFVAGIGNMSYRHFLNYNFIGGIFWICLFTISGFYFGNIDIVKNNFSLVIFAIIIISLLPGVISYINEKRKVINLDKSNI